MALELYEIFDNLESVAKDLKEAVVEDSDGGKTITRKELMDIAVKAITKLGVDILD